ncbi:MAG: PD40 domain-containing protein [Acidobacteria bacterium]|nr:PD40 domain-containing protein [Acidobacteriota bacterium]
MLRAAERRLTAAGAWVVLALGWPAPMCAASLVDPALRFRTLPTEHFIVYFHQGEDRLAARLAVIAEETWTTLQQQMAVTPPAMTHVLLVDQTDMSNGFATPIPYNTVFVTAVWPAGSEFIGNTEDWLRLVFVHEYTHIVHLDRSEGWARAVRSVFGRTPYAFPNVFLPAWQIEGLATYQESELTAGGRLHAGDFGAITAEAARARRPQPLDRLNGGLIDWPGGHAPYAYGAGFHAYLADAYGAEKLGALASATARRIPYTASRAFRRVYGKSLGALWREYQTRLVESTRGPSSTGGAVRLTMHGFVVTGPRFTGSRDVVYSVRSPHGFPALNVVALDGSAPRRLATRYLGSTTAVTRDTIYFDQLEFRRNSGQYSDLYALDRESGRVRRLTIEARLLDPDVSPDGQTLICVQEAVGRRDLVLVRPEGLVRLKADPTEAPVMTPVGSGFSRTNTGVTLLVSEPDAQFNAPRWSPDGRHIAVERHRRGALSEIVLVDATTAAVRVVASRPDARAVTPAWRRDGRAIVAALGAENEPFNLYEFPIDGVGARQLTRMTGGATWPDVSPDGSTIVFVGDTVDGQDLFTMPYPATSTTDAAQLFSPPLASGSGELRRDVPERQSREGGGPAIETQSDADLKIRATNVYRPWRTLKPTSWFPVIESDGDQIRAGAGVAGYDVLQYHAYAASATWLLSGPSDTIKPTAARPDWQMYYLYSRWRPVFWVSASDEATFFSGLPTDAGAPSRATDRERQIEGGVVFPVRHARTSHSAAAFLHRAVEEISQPAGPSVRNRTAVRTAWTTTTARTYGYSVGAEQGVTLGVTAELIRRALGSLGDATTVTADARAYLPVVAPHHVAAIRVAGATSTGRADMGRTFHLGGAGPNTLAQDFGRDALSLLRGFPANRFAGTHVALLNVDYRFPLAWPQRGIGTWPLFLRTIHGAIFADAGHAWTQTFRRGDVKTAAGAELSANLVVAYFLPLTATIGAAWGHDGSHGVAAGATVYIRLGRAF